MNTADKHDDGFVQLSSQRPGPCASTLILATQEHRLLARAVLIFPRILIYACMSPGEEGPSHLLQAPHVCRSNARIASAGWPVTQRGQVERWGRGDPGALSSSTDESAEGYRKRSNLNEPVRSGARVGQYETCVGPAMGQSSGGGPTCRTVPAVSERACCQCFNLNASSPPLWPAPPLQPPET